MNFKNSFIFTLKNFLISYGATGVLLMILVIIKDKVSYEQQLFFSFIVLSAMFSFQLLNLKDIFKKNKLTYITLTNLIYFLHLGASFVLYSKYDAVGVVFAILLNFITNLLLVISINKAKEPCI